MSNTTYTTENLNTMTNKDLMSVLNQLGGTFNKKASKATLIAGIIALQKKTQQDASKTEEPKTDKKTTKSDALFQHCNAIMSALEESGYSYTATDNDRDKKHRFTVSVAGTGRGLGHVYYNSKSATYMVNAGVEFTGSEYHKGWDKPNSAKDLGIETVLAIFKELAEKRANKKETKKEEA